MQFDKDSLPYQSLGIKKTMDRHSGLSLFNFVNHFASFFKYNALHKRPGGFFAKSGLIQMLGAPAHFENKPFPSTKSNRRGEAPQ